MIPRVDGYIDAFVCGYAPSVRAEKCMAFLQVYTDDSASDIGDKRLFFAGYLNNYMNWSLFSEAWSEELRAEPSIEYLKMVEANALRDQFQGWDSTAKDEKLRGLVRVIRHFEPISFEFSVSREKVWKHISPNVPRGLADPYFGCTLGVISAITQSLAAQGVKVPVDFIFDEQSGVSHDIQMLWDGFRSLPANARKLISGPPRVQERQVDAAAASGGYARVALTA